MATPLLSLRDVAFAYQPGQPVFSHVNMDIFPGQNVFLTGPNGAGKTTLFRCITGLERISAGGIFLEGQPIKSEKDFQALRRKVGYVLQNSEDQLFFPIVLDDIAFGPLNLGHSEVEAKKIAMRVLAEFGLEGYAGRNTRQLSGGEQKLAALAGIMAMEPELLLLDEPFNGLDSRNADTLRNILDRLQCAKLTITHDQGMPDGAGMIYRLAGGHVAKVEKQACPGAQSGRRP